ncbi:MAG: hypothetical protein Q7R83_03465 [bacterium]|nr:hypothetical protein [bacterium]
MNRSLWKLIFKIVIPLAILSLSFFLPHFHLALDAATFLTVISLLFAILIGFFIATTTTNYLNLQRLMAQENSSLASLYNLGILLQPSAKLPLANALDHYMIAALNYELSDYVNMTQNAFDGVLRAADHIIPKNHPTLSALIQNFHSTKTTLISTRQEIPLAARPIITAQHWIIMVLLAGLISFLLLVLRDGSWISALIMGILITTNYLILVLLYEIDGNYFAEEKLAFENAQISFHAIGKLSYYPSYALAHHRVHPPKNIPYRTGTYRDPSNPQPKETRIIRKF